MQLNFLNPVLDACQNVMVSMADLPFNPGKVELREVTEPQLGATTTGLICMKSAARRASVAIIFSDPMLENIALRMLPDDSQQNQFLAFDLVGEISNMIIGGAKALLLRQGYNFEITLPTVISGHEYLIAHQATAPIVRVSLNSDIGTFHLEACFEGPPLSKREKTDNENQPEAEFPPVELF